MKEEPQREDAPFDLPSERDPEAVDAHLQRAEASGEAGRDLDFLADLSAAAERERATLEAGLRPDADARTRRRWLAAAAAAAGIAATILLFLPRSGPTDWTALAHAEPPRAIVTDWRGPADATARAFRNALNRYAQGEFPAAADELSQLLAERPEHDAARFYLAAAREAEGRWDESERHYAQVAAHAEGFLAEHAAWRLANLVLRNGEPQRAEQHLRDLIDQGGAFEPNARQLLAEIEARGGLREDGERP